MRSIKPPNILSTSFWRSNKSQIIFIFAFSAYATNEVAGSPGKIWELLVEAAKRHPVDGNAGGSYLTMQSREGAIFFVINIVGNFGTVFLDNGTISISFLLAGTADCSAYRLLQQSYRRVPCRCPARLCSWRTLLVRHTLALRNHHGFDSFGSRE
jgi:hypothetical protein